MHESIFTKKITVFSTKGSLDMKVDIIKHETYVEIRLIEASNIFTLFVCTISQADFYMYKKEQEILVSYDRFIPILIGLFSSVSLNDGILTATMHNVDDKDFCLQFVEQTEFRNIKKLELKFQKPEEFQYRKYLGDILTRMESDNVKLIKENTILRERALKGDRALNDKLRFLEGENSDLKKRYQVVHEELQTIENRYNHEKDQFYAVSNRFSEIERENAQLNFELEKFQQKNSPDLREQINTKSRELVQKDKDLGKANDLISELKEQNKNLKGFKSKMETENSPTAHSQFEEMQGKLSQMENKLKAYKSELKEKRDKIEKLQGENKGLSRKLENAQNVYTHFYNKKPDDKEDMNNFTFEPENPPS